MKTNKYYLVNKDTGHVASFKTREEQMIFLKEVEGWEIVYLTKDSTNHHSKEPLIKDEKVRKAVRAWAEAESIPPYETVFYSGDEYSLGWYKCEIMFSNHIQGLKEKEYTIAELCGEEEE